MSHFDIAVFILFLRIMPLGIAAGMLSASLYYEKESEHERD